MSESTLPQQAAEPRKRSYWHLYDMVFDILFIPWLVFMAREFNIRPYIFPLLLTLGIPFFLIQLRSWSRWFHPERVPLRWPSGYAPGERLQRLEKWLGRILMLLAWIVIVGHHSMRRDVSIAIIWIAACGIVWYGFLRRYIQDRKYIPPPSPPMSPLKG